MHEKFTMPPEFEKSLAPWVGKTAKMMSLYLKDSFAEHGVDMTREQFILLKTLHDHDGTMQKDLAFITERNKGSLARLINTMEKKNLVARIPSKEDKRINCIFLTVNGRKTFENMQPVLMDCIQKVQAGISVEEIELAISVLEKIQNNLKLQSSCSKN